MLLTPLLRSLNLWRVSFNIRRKILLSILTLLRCAKCQTLLNTLSKLWPFCRRAPFLATTHTLWRRYNHKNWHYNTPLLTARHWFAHGLGRYLQSRLPFRSLLIFPTGHWWRLRLPSIVCPSLPKIVHLTLCFLNNSSPSLAERFVACEQTVLKSYNLKKSKNIVPQTMYCSNCW